MKLRDYQVDIKEQALGACSHDLIQLDTGGGKTPILAALAQNAEAFIAVAHRNVLITQISEKLAQFGISHNTISTRYTRRRCILAHRKIGKAWIDETCSTRFVASVDSVLARYKRGRLNLDTTKNWWVLIDEVHHALNENKWGLLKKIIPHARLIGFTATPARLDGRSLHLEHNGLFERLIQASALKKNSVNTLIKRGYLSDFKAYSIEQRNVNGNISVGKTEIYGDVLKHFNRLARDKQTVVMCPRIRNAEETAQEFKRAGFACAHISSRMSQTEVSNRLDAFRDKRIQVLCNVDIVGEGFDVPGIEAIIMLRKTASLVLYRQWIGRSLRPLEGKEFAVIIDHVGNVLKHDLPDSPINWNQKFISVPARNNLVACSQCQYTYKAYLLKCPECGLELEVDERRTKGLRLQINQQTVDWGLVEIYRERIKREEAEKEYQALLEREVIAPAFRFSSGAVGKLCEQLRDWYIAQLKPLYPPRAINEFLQHHDCGEEDFYIQQFTIKDLNSDNPKKAKKIFEKWQKSQSSMPTLRQSASR